MQFSFLAFILGFSYSFVNFSVAGICDYRPSEILGSKTSSIVAGASGATAATGVGMKVA